MTMIVISLHLLNYTYIINADNAIVLLWKVLYKSCLTPTKHDQDLESRAVVVDENGIYFLFDSSYS